MLITCENGVSRAARQHGGQEEENAPTLYARPLCRGYLPRLVVAILQFTEVTCATRATRGRHLEAYCMVKVKLPAYITLMPPPLLRRYNDKRKDLGGVGWGAYTQKTIVGFGVMGEERGRSPVRYSAKRPLAAAGGWRSI